MTRKALGKEGLPQSLRNKIITVGRNIRLARKRRGLTMQDMADRMFVTRKTLNRLESGDPGISLGIAASALLTLGLEDNLENLANPETDREANSMDWERHERKQRIRRPRRL